ncbi:MULTISPECIES: hypothetical protein [unclassified Mesorhizobium]|uniref:hypothetical protein n=1 Tax=unclassified Mesorhizobium TaxID=325217 RepID=UPI0030155CED
MIKTALIAMTIVGCDCDAKLCEFIRETPPQYASVADCEAALKKQILHEKTVDYPLVSGICRSNQPDDFKTASVQATDPAPVHPTMEPSRSAPIYAGLVEDGRSVLYRTAGGYTVVRKGISHAAESTADLASWATGWIAAKLPTF